jgi:hypothetical protein
LEQCWFVTFRCFVASLLFTGALACSATLSAQTSSLEGNVTGTDGRPVKDAEIRFEHKGGQVSPVISHTDIDGHYTTALPSGLYKMSFTAPGTPKTSITVKATGANSRIDFDLRPSAEKKIRHYVWVGGETGTHLPGHWVEAGIRAGPSPTP